MTSSATSLLKKLFLLFLVIAGLYFGREFLIPLAIGGILATLFLPFCKWMEQKIPRAIAVLVCLLVLLSAIAGLGALLGWQISSLTKDADLIEQKAVEAYANVQQYIYHQLGITTKKQTEILQAQQSFASGIIGKLASSLTAIFTGFILMLVYIFLFLYYRSHLKLFVLKLVTQNQKNETEKIIYSATEVTQQYLLGLTKMIVCLWIMYGIGFSIAGIKSPLFFAVLCGLLEIVPFIGNITGTSITVMVSAAQGANLSMLGAIVLTYGIIQFIQGWVLEPLIVGPQVKINPFATIIALVLGELLWGIPGIILAIPLIAMFKIVCDHFDALRPYGFLIGKIESSKKEPVFIKSIKSWFKKKIKA